MGGHRGGWYSWDRLDNNGEPSAARIVPEWQSLKEGQHLYRVAAPKWQPGGGVEPEGPNWWTVAVVEPNRTLVLQTSYALPSGQGFDPASGPTPPAYVEGIWGFHLRPAPGGTTRLVTRTRSRSRPRAATRPMTVLMGEPVHFIMQTRQFHNLRARVDAEA
jgi:proline iminopeptidase